MNKKIIQHSIIGIILILIDQITKCIVLNNFYEGQSIQIVNNFFSFTYVKNSGAAWGMFGNSTIALTILSVVIVGLFIYVYRMYHSEKFIQLSLALIIAGAIGNLIDRVRMQFVVDFFDFKILGYNFPVFNVADIAVTIGTIMIIGYFLLKGEKNGTSR